MGFGIQIEDGSDLMNQFAVEQNESSMQLYDWQRRGIEYFFNNHKSIFEVTTGAGKTFCAIEIIKRVLKEDPDVQVLIVVPKNVIMETGWYKELYDAGISLVDIGIYYGNIKEYAKITITNMQSLSRVAMELFDFLIFDECFVGTTKVITDNGIKKIRDIVNKQIECKVLSYNIKKNIYEYKKILQYHKIKERRKTIKITLENDEIIELTPDQLIFNGEKYIQASSLNEGDAVQYLEKQ